MKTAIFIGSKMVKEEISLTLLLHCSPQISIDDFIYSFKDFE